jgi:hypothetical protein
MRELVAKEDGFELYRKETKYKAEAIAVYNDADEYHLMLFDDIVYCFVTSATNRVNSKLLFEMEMPSYDDQEQVRQMILNVKSRKEFTELVQTLMLNYEWLRGMGVGEFVETLEKIGVKPYQAFKEDLDAASKEL